MFPPLNQLRWRCRRGMRELDIILQRFLETRYSELPEPDQTTFIKLLEQEDDNLWAWLMGYKNPPSNELQRMIQQLQSLNKRNRNDIA